MIPVGSPVRHRITGAAMVIRQNPAVLAGLVLPGRVRACAPDADPEQSYTIASEDTFREDDQDALLDALEANAETLRRSAKGGGR